MALLGLSYKRKAAIYFLCIGAYSEVVYSKALGIQWPLLKTYMIITPSQKYQNNKHNLLLCWKASSKEPELFFIILIKPNSPFIGPMTN